MENKTFVVKIFYSGTASYVVDAQSPEYAIESAKQRHRSGIATGNTTGTDYEVIDKVIIKG